MEETIYPFKWRRRLYRNPPTMAAEDFTVCDEDAAEVQAVLQDAAERRLQREEAIRIIKRPDSLVPGDFVVMRAPKAVAEPFYIAQVLDNNTNTNEVTSSTWSSDLISLN
jgi:hypothetical protein